MYLGALLGIATWLIFGLLFKEEGTYTALISMFVVTWASGCYEPKKLALMGCIIGLPAGIFHGALWFQQMEAAADPIEGIVHLAVGGLLIPLTGVFTMVVYAIEGLMFGVVAQLYQKHAIF